MIDDTSRPVLVTGATGYIGGRLVPRLLDRGRRVRCLVRDRRKLAARPWARHPRVEVVEADALDQPALTRAMRGSGAAYFLIHSMIAAGAGYRDRDRRIARGFSRAAEAAGVSRIIYLGGLGETGRDLSPHLASRREVEKALAAGSVPVTTLRAAMIIGSGSASFEILRYLVERLPVMITPRWVRTPCQPIAVRDALFYLSACLEQPETAGRTLDIGGPDVLTYADLMNRTARALGLRRNVILPVPVLTPRLSSLWIHLVTPVSHRIARPLAEGLRNPVVCRDDEAARLMPGERLTVDEAITAAMGGMPGEDPESSWTDAGPVPGDPDWAGGTVYSDVRAATIRAEPASVFRTLERIGGRQGWYGTPGLWRLRGILDKVVGGPGLSRGRRRADRLDYGDVVDFWRVTAVERGRRLVLRAEMRLPGVAILDFELVPMTRGRTRLLQTARFKPRGLLGLLYWFGVSPLHGLVFHGMLEGIRRRAEDPGRTRGGERPAGEAPAARA